ncbi:phage tail family protein [Cellulomonas sp. SG140]|uniref:phage tail family protein n=1 Tax=Cellulomonas sp. SG140 TaxID=2976536 RepID=UPI0021E9A909|nr:phage tail family protein [Cellulomonas sp. SG140]
MALESDNDSLDLDYVLKYGRGVQVLSGVTGLGLPPVEVRWLEGAGDGATFRGRRVLPRDIDLPLLILGRDRKDLRSLWSRLALMLDGKCKLRMIEDDGSSWWCNVYRVGGGTYTYGADTDGEREIRTVITLRAPNPFWVAEQAQQKVIG